MKQWRFAIRAAKLLWPASSEAGFFFTIGNQIPASEEAGYSRLDYNLSISTEPDNL